MKELLVENAAFDWGKIEEGLHTSGYASFGEILTAKECDDLVRQYDEPDNFRSKIIMSRHNFGKGEYKYFSYPLPSFVEAMRQTLYTGLASIANRWADRLNLGVRYPDKLETYLRQCHKKGQLKPTPLMLKYGEGDYNCLHQDIYGDEIFPLQVAICLSESGNDFTGGEFVLTHQRPRMQSVVDVVHMKKGEGIVFAVKDRPCQGARGTYNVKVRHGVSKVRSGNRYVLGVIFHDAL